MKKKIKLEIYKNQVIKNKIINIECMGDPNILSLLGEIENTMSDLM